MEKRYALFVSILVTIVVGGNYLFFVDIFPNREIVVIERVIDGDTVELEDGRKIRLLNINTPEKNEIGYDKALDFLKTFEGKTVELEIEGIEKYGRILGRLYYEGKYLNLEIVAGGFAHTFLVEENELNEFRKVEEEARKNGRGIWKKDEKYGCLNAEINKNEEYVILDNNCGNIEGWSIKDESTKSYYFKSIEGGKITLYSGSGVDNEEEIYWGREKVWNNDKDSIFIRNKEGGLVYYDSYGY